MIDPEQVFHVYPINDLREHVLRCEYPAFGPPYCPCICEPTWKEKGEALIILHHSFDGREGLQWTNEILKNDNQ